MRKDFIEEILKIINRKFDKKKYFLHEPNFDTNDIRYVIKCIRSSFVSTAGKYSNIFEKVIKRL